MEFVDIYNDERVLTGERLPRNTKLPAGKYTLYVLALIQNKDGYLITRRTLDKKWAAGAWEIPGGGVMAGESSEEAIRREVKEETGLDIQDYALLYSYKNIDLKTIEEEEDKDKKKKKKKSDKEDEEKEEE